MDFEFTEEQKILKRSVREFMDKEIIPLVEEHERAGRFPSRDVLKKLLPFGYFGALLPDEEGGAGLDHISYGLLVEELARAWGSLRAIVTICDLVIRLIYYFGNQKQKERYIPSLLKVDKLGFFALTEPNVGSDAGSVETRAVLEGDHYLISGTKMFISNGSVADVGILFASTDKSLGPKGVSAFIIDKEVTPYSTRDIHKMGLHCAVLSELNFEDAPVPRGNLLGAPGEGLKCALSLLNIGRCTVSFAVVGTAQAALEASIRYAQERHQFGKPIGSFQLVQEMIAEMMAKTDAARLLSLRAAYLLDKRQKCALEASIAKLYATEIALEVISKAIQIHGGYGYTEEFPVERYYRDIRHLTIAEGTNEIQKLIIGREALGLSAFI